MRSEPVDLAALARVIEAELRAADPTRALSFEIGGGLEVTGDPGLLRAVLQNLLSNAWKFTQGRPAAHIQLGKTDAAEGPVLFVRDDGAGFDMTYAGKLFSPFQRLHADKQFEGNGIGLATVQRIIRRHGRRVWAESTVEQGATFYFTIPTRASSPATTARKAA